MTRPVGLAAPPRMHGTKQRLLDVGLRLMLARGYHAVGVQDVLAEARVPKGSFYHHFASKEAFALEAIDAYHARVQTLLALTLCDTRHPPLDRVRHFFAAVREAYEAEGFLGCFLGALGQELSGTEAPFRRRIEHCVASIAAAHARCLEEARDRGDLPATCDPQRLADLLVNAWEGAALRSRLRREARPLEDIVEFCLGAMTAR